LLQQQRPEYFHIFLGRRCRAGRDFHAGELTRLRRFGRRRSATLCKSSRAFQKSALQRLISRGLVRR
jgi:hypothetical protein